jgi:hypothetical protein
MRVAMAEVQDDQGDTPPPTHSASTPLSDPRLALRRSRGAFELTPGSTIGRSASGDGAVYLFYHHRWCRRRRGGDKLPLVLTTTGCRPL